jgi:hypothetical protein
MTHETTWRTRAFTLSLFSAGLFALMELAAPAVTLAAGTVTSPADAMLEGGLLGFTASVFGVSIVASAFTFGARLKGAAWTALPALLVNAATIAWLWLRG